MTINIPNIIGNSKVFKSSEEDDDVLHFEGPRQIPSQTTKDTGFLSPTKVESDDTIGNLIWNNVTDAQVVGNEEFAEAEVDNDFTEYLRCSNYGFAIPSGSIILGIEVKIIRWANGSSGGITDNEVKIANSDNSYGDVNKAKLGNWEATNTPSIYGGPEDTWELPPEDIDISSLNSTLFGIALSANITAGPGFDLASVDCIQMKIYYK